MWWGHRQAMGTAYGLATSRMGRRATSQMGQRQMRHGRRAARMVRRQAAQTASKHRSPPVPLHDLVHCRSSRSPDRLTGNHSHCQSGRWWTAIRPRQWPTEPVWMRPRNDPGQRYPRARPYRPRQPNNQWQARQPARATRPNRPVPTPAQSPFQRTGGPTKPTGAEQNSTYFPLLSWIPYDSPPPDNPTLPLGVPHFPECSRLSPFSLPHHPQSPRRRDQRHPHRARQGGRGRGRALRNQSHQWCRRTFSQSRTTAWLGTERGSWRLWRPPALGCPLGAWLCPVMGRKCALCLGGAVYGGAARDGGDRANPD